MDCLFCQDVLKEAMQCTAAAVQRGKYLVDQPGLEDAWAYPCLKSVVESYFNESWRSGVEIVRDTICTAFLTVSEIY